METSCVNNLVEALINIIPSDSDNYGIQRAWGWCWLARCWVSTPVLHILNDFRDGRTVISPSEGLALWTTQWRGRLHCSGSKTFLKGRLHIWYVLWRAVITVLFLLYLFFTFLQFNALNNVLRLIQALEILLYCSKTYNLSVNTPLLNKLVCVLKMANKCEGYISF